MTPEESLPDATRRLVRTVDDLDDEQFAEPSLLPGWSRAHVVAHLTLNAEALAAVLDGVVAGEDVPMYSSQEQRDADIEELAALDVAELRDRFLASTTRFLEAATAVPDGEWGGEFRRTASGGRVLPRSAIPGMRETEVEVHHADLGAGYGPADWPEAFVRRAFDRVVADRADGPAALLRTPDGDVRLGAASSAAGEGPVVTGSLADLTWWLLGRGSGEGLETEGAPPRLEAWR